MALLIELLTQYPNIIRDRIPAIITESGRQCRTTVLAESAFRAALLFKLVEEAQEMQAATPEELLTELVNVLEVFDTILATHGFMLAQVHEQQQHRRQSRDGFKSRLQLDWVGE